MTFDPAFNFTTKQQYLVWRLRWKEHYFQLIAAVRQEKIAIKDAMRAHSKENKSIGDVWGAMSRKAKAVEAVNKHLHLLWRAKEEAARQVEARRNTTG